MLKLEVSWPCGWGTTQRPVLTLWWCWLNRSHCSLSQSKNRHRTAICGIFSLHFWDHDFKGREAKQEVSGRIREVNFELGTKHLACKFLNCHHSTKYDVNSTRNPQKGDNGNFCLHLWELRMPHLKYHSTLADRNTTTLV